MAVKQSDSTTKLCDNEVNLTTTCSSDIASSTTCSPGEIVSGTVSSTQTNVPSTVSAPAAPANGITSKTSSRSSLSDSPDICRICHCEGIEEPLISPCYCIGTMQYLHQSCLQRWIKSAGVKSCELCKFEFIMHAEIKPFKQWQKLDINVIERRKIMCSVAFNLLAVTCVLWSLYVLIEKTREEVKLGKLEWPFWTKLIVVAIGFTGGLVFLYVQCKMYLQLCIRWRQFNQRIIIHSISERRNLTKMSNSTPGHIIDSYSSRNQNQNNDCIITVLDANDLPPITSSTAIIDNDSSSTFHSVSLPDDQQQQQQQRHHTVTARHNRRYRPIFFRHLFRRNEQPSIIITTRSSIDTHEQNPLT
ncbi:unnamed protein product [Didymodactylos carnosus]|uniref:RING-CH-type domain-containing protein n=1 Tax=Didymodactylos carnosus TaxID=1234261 RepID=A0A814ULV4_9BILA|nr:unnamed protein product [Didymodactylos carnosus]CAF3941507.1 unnamed protein product [Didymodactylos carnosus]